jgi:DNA-directed RNA polymerase specialized sigma24 family protein
MEAALERLPRAMREVLVLQTVMGFTADEMGLALGLRPGSVWARLHRARRQLLEELQRSRAGSRQEEER